MHLKIVAIREGSATLATNVALIDAVVTLSRAPLTPLIVAELVGRFEVTTFCTVHAASMDTVNATGNPFALGPLIARKFV